MGARSDILVTWNSRDLKGIAVVRECTTRQNLPNGTKTEVGRGCLGIWCGGRGWWGRALGTAIIFDVVRENIIYREMIHDGTNAWQQGQDARKGQTQL